MKQLNQWIDIYTKGGYDTDIIDHVVNTLKGVFAPAEIEKIYIMCGKELTTITAYIDADIFKRVFNDQLEPGLASLKKAGIIDEFYVGSRRI